MDKEDLILGGSASIVIADDESLSLKAMELTLKSSGFNSIIKCQKSTELISIIESNKCDLILLDIIMPDISGLDLLKRIKSEYPEISVIMVTGVDDIETAIDCMKNGADDYVTKPVEKERLVTAVKMVIEIKVLRKENEALSNKFLSNKLNHPEFFEAILTRNDKMNSIFYYIEAIASTNHSVLITGETGVGKELVARAVHFASGRKGQFVAVNVAGLDDSVFSDTLFGHVTGAYTGANSERKGLVEAAARGTLFLDEIGDLSFASQVKLLRLLQERQYFQLGSDTQKRSETRVIAATSKSLEKLSTSESFRKDLLFRLKTHYIPVPPLRERKEDLRLLVESFCKKNALELNRSVPTIAPQVFHVLSQYDFPGNVRELEAIIYDTLSRFDGKHLSVDQFLSLNVGMQVFDSRIDLHATSSGCDTSFSFPKKLPTLRKWNDLLIREALERSGGKLSKAAKILGITPQALGQRIHK